MSTQVSTLRAVREFTGLSREKVAARIGCSAQTIYRWEKGTTPVRRYHLIALAEVYGVDVDDLVERGQAA